jgi:hypothetical protein
MVKDKPRVYPKWLPQCPWPADIWTMTEDEYVKAVPDPALRTRISGFLMRYGWEIARDDIFSGLCREIADSTEINVQAALKILDIEKKPE